MSDIYKELTTRGFVVVPSFLSSDELAYLQADYRAVTGASLENKNYSVGYMSVAALRHFEERLGAMATEIAQQSGIRADTAAGGFYFAAQSLDFPWHQDHENFFLFQQHDDALNFYVPICKAERKLSNLCVVPFDALAQHVPAEEMQRVIGGGARRFLAAGGDTKVVDDDQGREFVLPVDLEAIAVAPELTEGDLLLLRGDIIHRTQDTATPRVAASFRRTRGDAPVSKARLIRGGPKKREMCARSPLFSAARACFSAHASDTVTATQLLAYLAENLRLLA